MLILAINQIGYLGFVLTKSSKYDMMCYWSKRSFRAWLLTNISKCDIVYNQAKNSLETLVARNMGVVVIQPIKIFRLWLENFYDWVLLAGLRPKTSRFKSLEPMPPCFW